MDTRVKPAYDVFERKHESYFAAALAMPASDIPICFSTSCVCSPTFATRGPGLTSAPDIRNGRLSTLNVPASSDTLARTPRWVLCGSAMASATLRYAEHGTPALFSSARQCCDVRARD